MKRILTILLVLLSAHCAHAQWEDRTWGEPGWRPERPGKEGTYYFYRGLDFGSQRLIHPLRLIINGGYGILTVDNRDNRPGKVR